MKMLWNDMSLWEDENVNICKLCHCSYVHVYENIEIWKYWNMKILKYENIDAIAMRNGVFSSFRHWNDKPNDLWNEWYKTLFHISI